MTHSQRNTIPRNNNNPPQTNRGTKEMTDGPKNSAGIQATAATTPTQRLLAPRLRARRDRLSDWNPTIPPLNPEINVAMPADRSSLLKSISCWAANSRALAVNKMDTTLVNRMLARRLSSCHRSDMEDTLSAEKNVTAPIPPPLRKSGSQPLSRRAGSDFWNTSATR